MRSYQELLVGSGYGQRLKDFDALLRILDAELRLITKRPRSEEIPLLHRSSLLPPPSNTTSSRWKAPCRRARHRFYTLNISLINFLARGRLAQGPHIVRRLQPRWRERQRRGTRTLIRLPDAGRRHVRWSGRARQADTYPCGSGCSANTASVGPRPCSRVLRGGTFNNHASNVRCAYRNHNGPANRNNNVGFRPASTSRQIAVICQARIRRRLFSSGACRNAKSRSWSGVELPVRGSAKGNASPAGLVGRNGSKAPPGIFRC